MEMLYIVLEKNITADIHIMCPVLVSGYVYDKSIRRIYFFNYRRVVLVAVGICCGCVIGVECMSNAGVRQLSLSTLRLL